MKNRMSPMRRHSRFPVRWRVVYGTTKFVAEGTVLDLTTRGWRIAGTMPVVPGRPLQLKVCVPEKPEPLHVLRATVLWVHDHEFAIEAHEMAPSDHAWVIEFLRHKLGLMWMPPNPDNPNQEPSLQSRVETPGDKSHLSQRAIPSMENVLQRLLAVERPSTDMSLEVEWHGNSDVEDSEGSAPLDYVPETISNQVRRIFRAMVAIQETRARTNWDPIANN